MLLGFYWFFRTARSDLTYIERPISPALHRLMNTASATSQLEPVSKSRLSETSSFEESWPPRNLDKVLSRAVKTMVIAAFAA